MTATTTTAIATDYNEYLEKGQNLRILVAYTGFLPNRYSVLRGVPFDATTGVNFLSGMTELSTEGDGSATLGYDYVMVNGDEPLVLAEDIVKCIPETIPKDGFYVSNLMTDFENPVEVVDATNLKIVTAKDDRCLFISRSPIPYPKGAMDYVFHKFVGVGAFNRKALDFYHNTPRGPIEKIEENDSFRFIENHVPIYYYNAHCKSLSVDTPKDIAGVEAYLMRKEENKKIR